MRMFLPILVIVAMLASMFGMAIPVAADFDPVDSNANSIDLDLIRPNLIYNIGDTIYFSVRVRVPVADPDISFYPGKCSAVNATFTRPDGVVVYFATIAELGRGGQAVFNSTNYPGLAYVVDVADADPLVVGVVRVSANVTAISHCSVTGPAPGGNEYAYNEREISTQVTIEPDICIEKLVDCNDDQEYLHEDTGSYGDTPSWFIRVWNCGDSPLHSVNVTDTNGMSWGPFNLDIGESWNVTYDGDPIYETTTNNATAVGLDVFDGVVGPVYDSATNIIEEERCWGDETAWAYGGLKAKPNWDYVKNNNWGWTNGPLSAGSYEWDIYAGAGQNILDNGAIVGKLHVEYSGGCVNVTYELDEGYYLGETHLWVGSKPLPEVARGRGKGTMYTNAPGQFPYGDGFGFDPEDPSTWVETSWSWNGCGFSGQIYVAAHAVVWMEVECPEIIV